MKCDSCYLERESVKHRYYGICLCDDCHFLPTQPPREKPCSTHSPLVELKLLQRQVESAISMYQAGDFVPMTEQEKTEHASRFGAETFVIGDFVITKRKKYDFR